MDLIGAIPGVILMLVAIPLIKAVWIVAKVKNRDSPYYKQLLTLLAGAIICYIVFALAIADLTIWRGYSTWHK